MTVKETLFQQRRRMADLREQRLDAGLCADCGERPRGVNQDGTTSYRCEDCKLILNRNKRRVGNESQQLREGDELSDKSYFDTAAFNAYCVQVRKVFAKEDRPLSTADLRRAMGDSYRERWTFDAIDDLVGRRHIEEIWGVPSRWRIRK